MATKMDLKTFLSLKNEIIGYVQKYEELDKKGLLIPETQETEFSQRYEEIIDILSSHDLSEIEYSNWEGMILEVKNLDFSKTNANLDFNFIDILVEKEGKINFKGCKIKNFDFENTKYDESSFDIEFIQQNPDNFLNHSIPNEVRDRYYGQQLTLSDIANNKGLKNKVSKGKLAYYLRDIVDIIGLDETIKLDSDFIDKTTYWARDLLKTYTGEKSSTAVMSKLFEKAREEILIGNTDGLNSRANNRQDELGKAFKDSNLDLFLSEDTPQILRDKYYNRELSLQIFSVNQEYFKDVQILQAFNEHGKNQELISFLGENIKDVYSQYGTILDKITIDYNTITQITIPNSNMSILDKTEFIKQYMREYLRQHVSSIVDLNEIKKWSELLSLEEIEINEKRRSLIEKYGINTLIESGIETTDFAISTVDTITNLVEIKKMSAKIEIADIVKDKNKIELIKQYGIDYLLERGIENLEFFDRKIGNLDEIKQLSAKMPIELIPIGQKHYRQNITDFITQYGIDNIIKLDKETNGIFSNELWKEDTYLVLFAEVNSSENNKDEKTLTYEEFEQRTFELLQKARKKQLRSMDYPDYDFIQGDFRKKHSEIFIDGDVSEKMKKSFYFGSLNCEDVRKNPELIELLKGKDIIPAFSKLEISGFGGLTMTTDDGRKISPVGKYNMAELLCKKWGQEEFLKFIRDYGVCLDNDKLSMDTNADRESIEKRIQEQIFKNITENKFTYHGELPNSFKLAHPELFINSDTSDELKEKFYTGNLKFEDIRKNPELLEALKDKNLQVCFNGYKKNTSKIFSNAVSAAEKKRGLLDVLENENFLKLTKTYGKYLEEINPELFGQNQKYTEIVAIAEQNIYINVMNRRSQYSEDAPDFLRQQHPELFLDTDAPEHLKLFFYDSYTPYDKEMYKDNISNYSLKFEVIKEHPEYLPYLEGKNLKRIMPREYNKLFDHFDENTLIKLGKRNPEMIEKMVAARKEDVLHTWYQSTGGKFVPHHVVMINFPTENIDQFLSNGKKWSQLMKIEDYNVNDDGKAAILKASMAMGVFEGNSDSLNKTIDLFTELPKSLDETDYQKALSDISDDKKEILEKAYKKNKNGEYALKIHKQKNKEEYSCVRKILENANVSKVLNINKAHKIFDSFSMEYNPDFAIFFEENVEQILSNSDYITDISSIQRQFKDIQRVNSGRRLTLDVAQSYIKSIVYDNIEIGNESLAETSKIAGYSQTDFERLQVLFNEGKVREFKSIPRIEGELDGYTYEMLRVDDPLALTIGTLTDCCQNINGAGSTSMEHSMVSPDGNVFCVRDKEQRIVAQSWFWREKYTGCFDNIEIPDRIFKIYENDHPEVGKIGLTKEVLEVYKQATKDLMQEDKNVYDKLLKDGTITNEQYEGLLLGKVTIGLGYNDIRDAIEKDKNLKKDSELVQVKGTDRLPSPYTDASEQYILAEREGIVRTEQENLYVHQDTIKVYDETNLSDTMVTTLKRMETSFNKDRNSNLSNMYDNEIDKDLPKEKRLMSSIAESYGYEAHQTKIMATSKIAVVYSSDDKKIRYGDILSVPISEESTDEQKAVDQAYILNQIKKAIRQVDTKGKEIDTGMLSYEQREIYDKAMQEIEKEDSKRGER